MMMIAYDTETTGLPLWRDPSEDPRQPHLVQLAARLVHEKTREIVDTMNVIIRPEGWTIPDEVAAVHGITTERALDEGIPEAKAFDELLGMWNGHPRLGHNEKFDARIIRIASMRYGTEEMQEAWRMGSGRCTARLSTPICKLPPTTKMKAAGFRNFKTPNLGEAYKHFTGKDLAGAHDALVDVDACLEIYWAIQDEGR